MTLFLFWFHIFAVAETRHNETCRASLESLHKQGARARNVLRLRMRESQWLLRTLEAGCPTPNTCVRRLRLHDALRKKLIRLCKMFVYPFERTKLSLVLRKYSKITL